MSRAVAVPEAVAMLAIRARRTNLSTTCRPSPTPSPLVSATVNAHMASRTARNKVIK